MSKTKLETQVCPSCGAPLPGQEALLTCAYCGQQIRRETPGGPLRIEVTIHQKPAVEPLRVPPLKKTTGESYLTVLGKRIRTVAFFWGLCGLGAALLIAGWYYWGSPLRYRFIYYHWMSTAALSPDGIWLASAHGVGGNHRGTLYLWNSQTGQLERSIDLGPGASPGSIRWADGGKTLEIGLDQGTRLRWDTTTWKPHPSPQPENLPGPGLWSPDERWTASLDSFGFLRIWNAETGALKHKLEVPSGYYHLLAWAPGSDRLATCGDDYRIKIIEVESGRIIGEYRNEEPQTTLFSETLQGYMVWALDWSPDGEQLAAASESGRIVILDGHTGQAATTLDGHKRPAHGVAWSPDGAWLASASQDTSVRLWNTQTWQTEQAVNAGADPYQLVWAPDSRAVATNDQNGAEVVGIDGRTARLSLKRSPSYSYWDMEVLGWSPDSRRIALREEREGVLEVWELGQPTPVKIALPFTEVLWKVLF